MLLKICSVVSLDNEIHGYRLHYLDTGYCCSAELFVLWLHTAVMEKILEIMRHYKYLRISCEREIKHGGRQNIYQNNLIFSASDY